MTLDQYIETLSSLRDRYHAGDFEMQIDRGINALTGEPVLRPMDGDDFYLNLSTEQCVVGDACIHPECVIR